MYDTLELQPSKRGRSWGRGMPGVYDLPITVHRLQLLSSGLCAGSSSDSEIMAKAVPPFKMAEFDILYDQGISGEEEVLGLGVGCDVITKRGSFYSYGGERLGNGRAYAKETLASNPVLTEEIERAIRSTLAEKGSGNGWG